MKTCFTISFILLFGITIHAQLTGYNTVSAKQVKSSLHSDATIHFDENKQNAGFRVINHNDEMIDVGTIFAGGIWLSGKQENGEASIVFPTYGGIGTGVNYNPGPLNYTGSYDFDEVWKVKGDEIKSFLEDLSDGEIDNEIPLSIDRWPARGNSYYGTAMNDITLASFFDQDGDGNYDPSKGDYPIVGEGYNNKIPKELIYSVSHINFDQPTMMELTLHTSMFTFECENSSILDRSIFTRHKVELGAQQYDEFKFGLWTDFDLGCYLDDYIGCNPDNNSLYTYNGDPIDGMDIEGNCQGGVVSFGFAPPVHGIKFLNSEMNVFAAVVNNAIQDPPPAVTSPVSADEGQNIMNGKWRDGLPFTYGNLGYNPSSNDVVSHLFVDDPTVTDGWSQYNNDAPFWDYRTIAISDKGTVFPGQSFYIDMVNVVTLDESYNHVEKVALNQEELDVLQDNYNNSFVNDCSLILKNVMPQMKTDIFIQPNPNEGHFSIAGPSEFTSYELYNMVGIKMEEGSMTEGKAEVSIKVPGGMYLVRLKNQRVHTQMEKVVIVD